MTQCLPNWYLYASARSSFSSNSQDDLKIILPSLWRKQPVGSPAFTKKEIISPLIFIDKLCTIFLIMYPSPSYFQILMIYSFQNRGGWPETVDSTNHFNIIYLGGRRFVCYPSKGIRMLSAFFLHPEQRLILWFCECSAPQNLDIPK